MIQKKFYEVLDRFLSGNATEQDQEILKEFEDRLTEDDSVIVFKSEEDKRAKYEKLYHNISTHVYKAKRRALLKTSISIAASIIVLIAVGLGVYNNYATNSTAYYTLATKDGQKADITLSDGTVVTLNGGSVLKYPKSFSSDNRKVSLEGEAFFNVTKDKSRPFIIRSPQFNTTVLGTSFNVRAYSDDVQSVTVATGKVYVQSDKATAYILPDQQVVISENGMMDIKDVVASSMYNWKDNVIELDNTSISDLAKIVRRQYGVDFVNVNNSLNDCKFSGKFNNATIIEVLESLKYMNGIEYHFVDSSKVELLGSCHK